MRIWPPDLQAPWSQYVLTLALWLRAICQISAKAPGGKENWKKKVIIELRQASKLLRFFALVQIVAAHFRSHLLLVTTFPTERLINSNIRRKEIGITAGSTDQQPIFLSKLLWDEHLVLPNFYRLLFLIPSAFSMWFTLEYGPKVLIKLSACLGIVFEYGP